LAQLIELDSENVEAIATDGRGRVRGLIGVLEWHVVLALVLLAACGFGLRVGGISRVGLAEDEINKLEAVRSYAQGDITQNAEHPMVLKTLIFFSTTAASASPISSSVR